MSAVWNLEYDFAHSGQNNGYGVLFNAFQNGVILNASPTQFDLKDGGNLVTFHGTFVVNGNVIQSGTITGFDAYYTPVSHLIAASGHTLDFGAFNQALAAYQANNTTPLLQLIFGEPMTVNGSDWALASEQVFGGLAADQLYGNGGSDSILDFAGDDFIFGGGGPDELIGDYLFLGGIPGNDFLFGGDGDDLIRGAGGDDFLSGGSGLDELDGDDGTDTADYSEKADAIVVILNGPTVADVTVGGVIEDTIRDIENVNGGTGNDAIIGDGFINRLVGGDGDDRLSGNGGNDALFGDAGRDKVKGGPGNDEIHGGKGLDILRGGANSDTFHFDTKPAKGNVDRLADFSHVGDTIVLEHDVFAKLDLGKLKAAFFQIGTAAGDGDDRVIYNEANGALSYDKDGAGGVAQAQFAQLKAGLNVAADDFLVV